MIYLPSDNSHGELVRTFRLLQEALNSRIPTTTVIDKTVTNNITKTSASGGGSGTTIHNDLTGRSDAGAHPASAVTFSPTGGISSSTVQAAIAELDTEKASIAYVGHDVTGEFTGFDVPENVTVSYDSTTRKVTLTGSFNAYYRGQKVAALTNGWVSDAHAVATAPYFLYYDGTNFVWSTTSWNFDKLMICVAIWNSAGTFIYALRECHGLMQWQSHRELHETTGTYLKSGGDLSSYVLSSTTAANRRPDIAATDVADEDLITTNSALTTKLYSHHTLSAAGTSTFTTGNAEILPVTGSQPYYNQFSSPNWVQTAVSNNTYTTAFCIAIPTTNDAGSQAYRYVWTQGQSEGTLAQMQAVTFGSLNLGQLSSLTPEFVPIAKAIIRYQGGNWTIEQIDKLTISRTSGVSTSGNFLSAVSTDASLTGAGTASSLLSVARSATAPVANGTAAVGTSDASSRSDHVHPTDTSRAANTAVVHNTGNETGLAGNKTWTGVATFSNSTAATSTTTGAVVVTGGLGVGGSAYFNAINGTTATLSGLSTINNRIGIGTSSTASNALAQFGANAVIPGVTGTSQFGITITAACSSAATNAFYSLYLQPRSQADAFNCSTIFGLYVDNASLGAGSTATTSYGIYIGNITSASTTNYAIYTNSGLVRIGGSTSITDSTTSTTTSTGALKVTGGIGCGDYVTSKYRSSDGTAGLTATRAFYAASSSGGAVNVLNTVTIKDGIITAWSQA